MATVTTSGFHFREFARSKVAPAGKHRRRQITPDAGRALEKLGHAIEYLADELVHNDRQVDAHNPQVEAVQMLMALNRQVYYDCPFAPTFLERLRAFFHLAWRAGIRQSGSCRAIRRC